MGFLNRFREKACPYCGSQRIRREGRKGFVQMVIWPMLNWHPYHCGECGRNFFLVFRDHYSQ